MKRVGIFSGTFDPVHVGHLHFARVALVRSQLDKIFFLVEPAPRRKQGVKAFIHRLNMVQLATADEPKFGVIVLEQAQFTPHETLPILVSRFEGAGLYMLMGDDMLAHLGSWPHVDELIKSVHFIIGVRGSEAKAQSRLQTLEKTRGLSFDYEFLTHHTLNASSSNIRSALRNGEKPETITSEVLDYIEEHHLYNSASGAK